MKAAVLYESPGVLVVEDVSVDKPGPNEVLVRVGATGLCHSDLHYMETKRQLAGPTVMGHEGAGVVEAVGSDVTYVKPGDHVVGFPTFSCGRCEFCMSGRGSMCAAGNVLRGGTDKPRLSRPNGDPLSQFIGLSTFAEQMLVHEHQTVKIDPAIPFDRAALVGCGVPTGIGAVIRTAKVPEGATVAVIGCGGIGLNAVQGAVLACASRIVAIDINDGKLALARQFGATDTINSSTGDAVEQLHDLIPGQGGVDYSFEAVGSRHTYELAFAVLRMGGTATAIGVAQGNFELPMYPFLSGKKFQGSTMGSIDHRRDIPFILDLYMRGQIKLDELVSDRLTLDRINEGYAEIRNGSIARSVVVFD
ncbi:MAG: Zn-dependent alcohol dehydrogenase [bacterium]|nr:Zn-dependent alcohol dehydrogenase [bacterium]